jgi:DNA-binding transcriptional LysR family regulator
MGLRHLEQIVAICETGGFGGAARKLRISQPTLSRSISLLEAKLGLALFERSGSGAKPTAHGRFVADRAMELLTAADRINDELAQRSRDSNSHVRIGVGPAVRVGLLPSFVRRATQRLTGLQIETRQASGRDLIKGLVDRQFDIVLVHFEWAEGHAELIRSRVVVDDHAAVVRPAHPTAAYGNLTVADFLYYGIAASNLTPSFNAWIEMESGQERIDIHRFRSDDYSIIKQHCQNTDCIALGPRFLFNEEVSKGLLIELPMGYREPYECWLIATPEATRLAYFPILAQIARSCGRALSKPAAVKAP